MRLAGALGRMGMPRMTYAPQAPEVRVLMVVVHSDSGGRGVCEAERGGVDAWPSWLKQYVRSSGGTALGGYPLTPGIVSETPLQGAGTYASADYLSPYEEAVRRIYDDASTAETPYEAVIMVGCHFGGLRLVDSLSGQVPYTEAAMEESLAVVEAAYPGAQIDKVIFIDHSQNDKNAGGVPSECKSAMDTTLAAFAAVDGWEDAKVIGVGGQPSFVNLTIPLIETGLRTSTLETGGYWVTFPEGLGHLHLGDTPGDITTVREGGYDYIGRVASVALGFSSAVAPNFTLTDNYEVQEGSDASISVGCDQPFYLTGVSTGSSLVSISGDLDYVNQVLEPTGGEWPAYDAGTPANNTRAYAVDYVTGDRATGTLSRNLVVTEVPDITWLAYDDFNRADTSPSSGGLGDTSGDGTSGGGLTWLLSSGAFGAIDSGKATLPVHSGAYYPIAGVNVGSGDYSVRCKVVVAGAQAAAIYAGGDPSVDSGFRGVFMYTNGLCRAFFSGFYRDFGNFGGLSAGTYELGIDYERSTDTATFLVDGVVVLGPLQTPFGDDFSVLGNYAGFGKDYYNDSLLYDDFKVVALP